MFPYYNNCHRGNSIMEYMMMFNYGRRYGCCDYGWTPGPYYAGYGYGNPYPFSGYGYPYIY